MPKIIISYRRLNDAIAGRIRDKLASHYGNDSVFMDVDNIPFGVDFREHIDHELKAGDIMLAVIGPTWLGPMPGQQPRIFEETDPVRVEIEAALRRRIPLVPILVDGATMPQPQDLPEAIRQLSFYNAAAVDAGRDFHQHMDRVIRSVDRTLRERGLPPAPARTRLYVLAGGAAVAVLAIAGGAWLLLSPPPGTGANHRDVETTALGSARPVPAGQGTAAAPQADAPKAAPAPTARASPAPAPAPKPPTGAAAIAPPPVADAAPRPPAPAVTPRAPPAAAIPAPAPSAPPRELASLGPPAAGPALPAAAAETTVTAVEEEVFTLCGRSDYTLSFLAAMPGAPGPTISLSRKGVFSPGGPTVLAEGKTATLDGGCTVTFASVGNGVAHVAYLKQRMHAP